MSDIEKHIGTALDGTFATSRPVYETLPEIFACIFLSSTEESIHAPQNSVVRT